MLTDFGNCLVSICNTARNHAILRTGEWKLVRLLVGIKLGTPNREFMQHARDQHLLIAGGGDNCVRLLPPLNLTVEEASEAISKLEKACEVARAKMAAA